MTQIENNHNVYVLGAGFSSARGFPIVSDFMNALRDAHEWLTKVGRKDEAQAVANVLRFRQTAASAAYRVRLDLENIEELFSLASAIGDDLSRDIRLAIAATLDYRSAVVPVPLASFHIDLSRGEPPDCYGGWVQVEAEGDRVRAEAPTYDVFIAALLGLLSSEHSGVRNTILSFNYDVLVEEALTRLKVPFWYGFRQADPIKVNVANGLSLRSEAETLLLKLHGSINWAMDSRNEGLTIFSSYACVRNASLVPELVPPSWNKSFSGPLSSVWSRALDQIKSATRIVIIGYSMPSTDQHFKYLMAAGLRDNISLREIVFVNPNAAVVEARANELFGELNRLPSVRIVGTRLSQFINPGTMESQVSSIGRSLSRTIYSIVHPW